MRTRHRRTLQRIFATPTPSDIRWAEIESMLRAAGVEVSERAGSRVGLSKEGERITVHRPHPHPEAGRATVRAIARFLDNIGVRP
ncbi:MAG: type II toxin-antitoxin system HicA family toxin [Dehalococcoidia bacterium]|nr:type II toxin-antitoxin system HicA family toxin [Dehalococcoidia bacterium]